MAPWVFITTFTAMVERASVCMARNWSIQHLVLRDSATAMPEASGQLTHGVALRTSIHTARGCSGHTWHLLALDTNGNRIQGNTWLLFSRRSIDPSHGRLTRPSPVLRVRVPNRMSSPGGQGPGVTMVCRSAMHVKCKKHPQLPCSPLDSGLRSATHSGGQLFHS